MSNPVELSRKFLSDAGGWKEMKEARSLHSAGRVLEGSYENGWIEGSIKDKAKSMKVRMQIRSRTDIENHCPCFRARRDGIICAHALAVGLEVLEPTAPSTSPAETPTAPSTPKKAAPRISSEWPKFLESPGDDSIPAELFVVIPPNLANAWEKGSVPLGIEIDAGDGRKLLKAHKASAPLFLQANDVALIRALQEISPETVPGMVMVDRDSFLRLLNAMPGHPGVSFGKKESVRISWQPVRLTLKRTGGSRFQVNWPDGEIPFVGEEGAWLLSDDKVFHPVAPGLPSHYTAVLEKGMTLSMEQIGDALALFRRFFDMEEIEVLALTPTVELEVEGSLNHLDAILTFNYDGEKIPAGEALPPIREKDGPIRLPDTRAEKQAIHELEEWGFDGPKAGGKWVLKDKAAIQQFLAHGFHRLRSDWKIGTGERFDHASSQVEPVSADLDFRSSGENWFAMEVEFGTPSGETVSRQEIQRLLQMGQNSKKLANGKIAVVDTNLLADFSEVIQDCDPEQLQPGTYRIDQSKADYLRETASDFGFGAKGTLPWETAQTAIEFSPVPDELSTILRPYQKTGVEWMQRLAGRGMGGILADDMGLGKTLQTLTFIQSVGGQALVVCPSSLVFNWVSEAEKFTPDLKAVALEGPDRMQALENNEDADIFVTSYALLRRDEKVYRDHHFRVIVLDEAQHIKNPEAKVSKAAHRLQGDVRFALTGTPIENSVRDLWSITQFALPGYLGKRSDFSERFEKPLQKSDGADAVQKRLSRRLRPIVMRRLKEEVAPELPEKIEQVIYCDLTKKQQEVYQKILQESRATILDAQGGRKRMLALTALLRLRQTCCDLRLLGLNDVEPEDASVKSDALGELLENAIEGGHRVLIFSQFVEMLQILVPDLAGRGIGFCYLDGSTKNRGEVVKKFQEDESNTVFLISLKAGGVGLNLTGADTVIHIDPWWNPAVEAQATDRAHRIGQEKVVTAYKLITRNTVEEKILALQNRKREMMDSLLGDAAGDASLSESELLELFE